MWRAAVRQRHPVASAAATTSALEPIVAEGGEGEARGGKGRNWRKRFHFPLPRRCNLFNNANWDERWMHRFISTVVAFYLMNGGMALVKFLLAEPVNVKIKNKKKKRVEEEALKLHAPLNMASGTRLTAQRTKKDKWKSNQTNKEENNENIKKNEAGRRRMMKRKRNNISLWNFTWAMNTQCLWNCS